MNGERKPRVFLSSSIKGLEDLRSEIRSFFKDVKGYLPICHGDVSSGGLSGQPGIVKQCLDGVRSSDAFFLIIDRKYGIPDQIDEDGKPISITELEYLTAVKKEIELYIFCRIQVWVAHEIWLKNPDISFEFDKRYEENPKLLMNFLTKLKTMHPVNCFMDSSGLKDILKNNELGIDVSKYQPSQIDEHDDLGIIP